MVVLGYRMEFHKPEDRIYGYKPNNTFMLVHNDKNPFIFVRGPMGSGKSVGCVMHVFLNALKQNPDYKGRRRSRYLIIRATYPSLKTTVVKTWLEYFGDHMSITYDTPFKGRINFDLPDGTELDIELNFLAVASADEIDKLLSYEVTGIHVNEANEMDEFVLQTLKGRFGRYPSMRNGGPVDPFILLDYNSIDTEHWLYRLAEEVKPEKHSFYVQPPAMLLQKDGSYIVNEEADNVENVRPDYYIDLVAGNDPDWINVYVLNNYGQVRSGKPVYKDYKDVTHSSRVSLKPLQGVPLIVGMDQGLTPAAAFCQLSPTGQLLTLDEIVTTDCSIREFCEDHLKPKLFNEYNAWSQNYTVIIDPAACQRSQNDARSAADVLRECGINYRLAKTNNSKARLDAVVYFLRKQDGFILAPKCTYLKKGFISEYKYEELRGKSSGLFHEKPMKNIFSHVHDALQYAAMEIKPNPIRKTFVRKNYQVASSIGGY